MGSATSAAKTDPDLWKRVVARVRRGGKGGDPGQWSARKAQLATTQYQKEGGGYVGPPSPRNALARWTREHRSDRPAPRRDPIAAEFQERVNMTRSELRRWLTTKRSLEVGQKRGEGSESVGHASGRRIVELLGKRRSEPVSREERAHMREVIGYIRRHSAQRPAGDIRATAWRASLRNWGHDPLKEA